MCDGTRAEDSAAEVVVRLLEWRAAPRVSATTTSTCTYQCRTGTTLRAIFQHTVNCSLPHEGQGGSLAGASSYTLTRRSLPHGGQGGTLEDFAYNFNLCRYMMVREERRNG